MVVRGSDSRLGERLDLDRGESEGGAEENMEDNRERERDAGLGALEGDMEEDEERDGKREARRLKLLGGSSCEEMEDGEARKEVDRVVTRIECFNSDLSGRPDGRKLMMAEN